MFHCGRMKNGGANIVQTNEVSESMEDSRTEDWTLNFTESGVGGFSQTTLN